MRDATGVQEYIAGMPTVRIPQVVRYRNRTPELNGNTQKHMKLTGGKGTEAGREERHPYIVRVRVRVQPRSAPNMKC